MYSKPPSEIICIQIQFNLFKPNQQVGKLTKGVKLGTSSLITNILVRLRRCTSNDVACDYPEDIN